MPAAEPHWHALDGGDALAEVKGRREGLSSAEAHARLERVGLNRIAPMRPEPARVLLWRQLSSPLIVVLIASGAVALALGEVADGAVVLAVVVANSVIGFVQEWKAGRAIQALAALVPERATVVRDGSRAELDAEQVVPGDIVELRPGERVPADARLLALRALEVDESPLTGESLPVAKDAAPVPEDAIVADRASMLHGGTLVTSGTASAVVVSTGERTELGRISELMRRTEAVETPLTRGLAGVARLLTVVICVVAAALLAVALARGYELVDAVLAAVSLAVAAIPEGLPAIVTIALAVGVQRMAHRRAVIRRLPAVETLGSTTVICTDKTGTLTQNRMTVAELWGEAEPLLRAAALCSDGTAPTEVALLDAAERAGVDVEALRMSSPRLDAIPFDSERKLMATLHPRGRVLLKGAPEVVLERCAARDGASEAVEALAADGKRVLAVAEGAITDGRSTLSDADLDGGFTLLGLAALVDPPRDSALAAVSACREAGVDVKMITGDHVSTARAIASRFGLAGAALTGRELDALDDGQLERAAGEGTVFARVAPEHKLRLVRALQARGEVVAMTGDGVNDAPALKQADIGVAMGESGTAAAREAADVVLTDDDFASIEAAVEEGRHVFDNVQKAIAFVLPTNLGEALIVLVAVLAFPLEGGVPKLPVEPTQILWVNLIATVTLALPLAVEALEPGLMSRAPRAPGTPVIGRFLVARTIVVSLLMTVSALALFEVRDDQTIVVTTIVLFQVVYLLECRSLEHSILHVGLWSNRWALAGIAGVLALQAIFIYAPPMQDAFGSAPLSAGEWLLALAAAATVLPVVWLEKWWRRNRSFPHVAAGSAPDDTPSPRRDDRCNVPV
ncbi:MAG TPA: HAD-IC family P-type ATPase [Solirubrobacteraceae bacterium]|nr:HAD-IC family P-type ATPase [Solirubrobacteraceae bacterium]